MCHGWSRDQPRPGSLFSTIREAEERDPGNEVESFLPSRSVFALVVHSRGVSKYGHYTAQGQESPLDSGATNKAFFILGR